MKPNDLNGLFDAMAPSEAQKEKMLTNILNECKKPSINRMQRNPLSMAVAIVTTFFLTVTAVLAGTPYLHRLFIRYLNPSQQQVTEMIGNIQDVRATVTKNGVTVSVQQMITDSHGAYIIYDMTVPDWMDLTEDIQWHSDVLSIDSAGASGSGVSGTTIIENSKNKRTVMVFLTQTNPIQSGTARLVLENLERYRYDKNGVVVEVLPLIQGTWELQWDYQYVDRSKTIEPNAAVSFNGSTNTITKITVSPLSAYITILGDDILTSVRPVLIFKDGSQVVFDARSETKSFVYGPDEGNRLLYRFEKIMNVDALESITIGDVTIPFSQTP